MKNLSLLLIILSFVINSSCKKEKIPEDNCETIEKLVAELGYPLYPLKKPVYNYPDFNPNNSDEIIFTYREASGPESKLIKYNIRTKEYEEILTGLIQSRVRWNKKDWILLSLQEEDSLRFDIWKMKSSGDSLTQLTFSGNCFTGEWNISGEYFTYELGKLNPNLFVTSNTENLESDTFPNGINGWGSWRHSSKFSYADLDGLLVGDFIENNLERVYTLENTIASARGVEWINNTEIVWTDREGVYIFDIDTRSRKTIISTCNSKNYRLPTYSQELDKLMLIRERLVKADETESEITTGYEVDGESFHELVMMNIDGTSEEVIKIEE